MDRTPRRRQDECVVALEQLATRYRTNERSPITQAFEAKEAERARWCDAAVAEIERFDDEHDEATCPWCVRGVGRLAS
jgi:hypothetical protein